jgi:hypothetical protein
MNKILSFQPQQNQGTAAKFRYVKWLGVLLICALCASVASNASAAFSNVQQTQSGYNNFFSGNTQITSGTLNNSGQLTASFSSLTADTGPLFGWDTFVNGGNPTKSGNYFYGVGVLAWNPSVSGNGTTTINNNAGAKMQGIVTGSGQALAAGLYSIQGGSSSSVIDITVNNSGTIDGQVLNHDGDAAGVWNLTSSGGGTVVNNSGATCSATAKYYATAIFNQCYGGASKVVNSGQATATATGGTEGATSGRAYVAGIDVYGFDGGTAAPVNFQNYGGITARTTGGTTQKSYGAFVWSQGGTMFFKNTGSIIASSTSASGGHCEAVYCGSRNGNDTFYNSGTITGTAGGSGGWGVGCENDSVGQTFTIFNSGSISHNNGYGLYVQGFGSNANGTCFITNTSSGSISGTLGVGVSHWNGPVIFDNSGAISGPIDLGPQDDTVYMKGSGSVTGTVRGNGGNDRLIFSLSGTLQSVNGVTATQGGNLANYSLGQSGNIVVSGKTYKWDSCTVSGSAAN